MTPHSSSQSLSSTLASYARTLASYDAPAHLAFGGMAELFLAWQRGANGFRRQVVLKRILPQLSSDKTFLEMFLNEARITLTLSHPNIVRCYDLLEVPEGPIIVMEYVRGATVREIMGALRSAKQTLPYGLSVRVMSGVCAALDHAYHSHGPDLVPSRIIHRDVTPTNILVSMDGDVKLTDFGIAKAVQSDMATRTATLKGKCAYMSPEQILGEPMDHRADVFSAGVMLYELTTGQRVFRRETDMATMQAILRRDIPEPERWVPDYPPALKAIVMRAMAHSPKDRYDRAGDLSQDLQDCARAAGWSTERGELEALMHQRFPERAAPAQPLADADRGTPAIAPGQVTSLVSVPDSYSISLPSHQGPRRHVHHWEIAAVLALVMSALFWVFLTL
jgi:eukaryotic-like serine/threonine-protein kinase